MIQTDRLGDQPIEQHLQDMMKALGEGIDRIINCPGEKQNGFILQIFPLNGHEGRCNYISNARREDVIVLLKEQLSRFEGMAEQKAGRA